MLHRSVDAARVRPDLIIPSPIVPSPTGLSLDILGAGVPRARPDAVLTALLSGGDSRTAIDPATGLNKYLCPAEPAPSLLCLSSCTASPISTSGYKRAAASHADITTAPSARARRQRLAQHRSGIEAALLRYFTATDLAEVMLFPSGTDAMLITACLLAAEQKDKPVTAILPVASETGTGVPLAAACRQFDGPNAGALTSETRVRTVEIPLRGQDGAALPIQVVNAAFGRAAAEAVAGGDRPVVYLTHASKTGLIAPVTPPEGADVIVDACQARIEPATVAAYLRRGWPVVVTGSKFFGGPAFCAAVFFPRGRMTLPAGETHLGTILRWTAALESLERFAPAARLIASRLRSRRKAIESGIAANPALLAIDGMTPHGNGWAGQPSIFTFGIRGRAGLLPATALRPFYERLARDGILLGQPVSVGEYGGLRIAFGARDLLDGREDGGLPALFAALRQATNEMA